MYLVSSDGTKNINVNSGRIFRRSSHVAQICIYIYCIVCWKRLALRRVVLFADPSCCVRPLVSRSDHVSENLLPAQQDT
jgi:hypothetical protein